MKSALAAAALLAATVSTAYAEPKDSIASRAPARNAISVQLANSGASALAVQVERLLPRPRFSLAGSLGVRRSAAGDYRGAAVSAGAELRYWLTGRTIFADLPPGSMAGWFAAARLDLGYSATFDRLDDRKIGATLGVSETAALGYRLVVWRGLSLSAEGGLGIRTEFDRTGRLAPWTRGSLAFAVSLDWLW